MPDSPVTPLLALANSRHGPGVRGGAAAAHDHLASADDARSYLNEAGLAVPPDPPSGDELARLRALRDLTFDVTEMDAEDWRSRLGELVARHHFRFDAAGRLVPASAGWDGLTASFVPQLFELDRERARLRRCANPDCRWLFVDGSRNHSRVWCDMGTCGSRAKMSRYRSRKAGSRRAL